MQYQPPDQNNPANPLIKVAALTLEKEYLKISPNSLVRIIATLNFKRSNDLRGRTKTKTGEEVTISFSLALKRASLELLFVFENSEEAKKKVISVERVAHLSELQTRDLIKDVRRAKRQANKKASIGLSASGKAGISGLNASAKAIAGASARTVSKVTREHKIARSTSKNNISVTYGGNLVHWEINPNLALEGSIDSQNSAWLEGEVFKSLRGAPLDACLVGWRHDEKVGTPTVVASVFVTMPDLIIDNVQLLTDSGDVISTKDIAQSSVALFSGSFGIFQMSDTKERLVRQVIRKHLLSQGMMTEGARVQICKAYS
jgi:hypothetical protein